MIKRYQEKAEAELQITLVDGNKFGIAAMQIVISGYERMYSVETSINYQSIDR